MENSLSTSSRAQLALSDIDDDWSVYGFYRNGRR
jgi:hypothetical protein